MISSRALHYVRPLGVFAAFAAIVGGAGCASTRSGGERVGSTTVIQPPSPFGLPKLPAIRLRNPGGFAPRSLGNVVQVVKDPPPGPSGYDVVQVPPTKPPFAGAVWQQGYWIWDGERYLWIDGRWETPPAGYVAWEAPRWEQRAEGWVFVPGRWR